jgi:hypothetical protein
MQSSSRLSPLIHELKVVGQPNPKAYEQVNVVGHKDISSEANTEVSGAPAVFDERRMYFGRREQAEANVGIKRYDIDRRIEALEDYA